MFSIATPFKGTEFYDRCREEGYLVDDSDNIDPFNKSVVSYPSLPKETLERLQRQAYRRFYLRPGAVLRRLVSMRSVTQLLDTIRTAFRIFKGRS